MKVWYEAFVDMGKKGTRSFAQKDTKSEIFDEALKYKIDNPDKKIHIDLWQIDEDGTPWPIEEIDCNLTTEEVCRNCNSTIIIPAYKKSICPECGFVVYPCSACLKLKKGQCDWDDNKKNCSLFS